MSIVPDTATMTTPEPQPGIQPTPPTTPPVVQTPFVAQTQPVPSRLPIPLVGLFAVIVISIGIVSPRIFIPTIVNAIDLVASPPARITVNGVVYSPLVYFLRLEERRADVYPAPYIRFMDHENIKHLPLRGNIPGLEELTIIDNPLEDLPDTIGSLMDLKALHIVNTRLTALPDSIGDLSNLEDLTVYSSHLKRVPDSIGNLSKLVALNLAYNDLETLPESIGKLTNLEVLDLTGNKFTSFPHPIPPNLKWLIIGGNRIPVHTLINYTIDWADDIFY